MLKALNPMEGGAQRCELPLRVGLKVLQLRASIEGGAQMPAAMDTTKHCVAETLLLVEVQRCSTLNTVA